TATADISAATLTVTGITAAGKVYDGTTDASLDTTGADLAGFVSGDDVTLDLSGAIGAFETKDVGTGKGVTITGLPLLGAAAENYALGPPPAPADITPATLTASGLAAGKVYDGTTDATIDASGASLAGLVVGDDVTLDSSGVAGTFDTKGVGTGKV